MADYEAGKTDWLAAGLPSEGRLAAQPTIGRLARPDAPTCALGEPVADLRDRLGEWGRCWVINDERILLGQLREKELRGADPGAVVEDVMLPGPSTFRPNVSIHEMFHFLQEHEMAFVPVTTSDGRLLGVAGRADIERAWATDSGSGSDSDDE